MVRSRSPRWTRRTSLSGASIQMVGKRSFFGAAGALAVAPIAAGTVRASDRELQAALDRLSCVPAQVRPTSLSPGVTLYDVICKGSKQPIAILCLERQCRLQVPSREDERKENRSACVRPPKCGDAPLGYSSRGWQRSALYWASLHCSDQVFLALMRAILRKSSWAAGSTRATAPAVTAPSWKAKRTGKRDWRMVACPHLRTTHRGTLGTMATRCFLEPRSTAPALIRRGIRRTCLLSRHV